VARFDLVPGRTALISVDLQNCFVADSPVAAPDGSKIVERLNRLAIALRQAGGKVIFTRHVVRPDGANTGILGETIPAVKAGIINADAPSAQLHPSVDRRPGDIVLDKPQFGAFYGTDLEIILRAKNLDTVIVGGIATNFCCETTAREAHAREFKVIFLSDGTATFDLPDTGMGPVSAAEAQRATCAVLGFGFAEVIRVDEAIARLR